MTTTQHGNGTTTERQRHGKIETTETINAGEIAQRERWPDIVAFMLDEGMLLADQAYGWGDFCRLMERTGGGNSGEGWLQMELLRFQKIIGYMHLRVLHELLEWPVPQFGNEKSVKDAKWRLNRCMHLVRSALHESIDAAEKAREHVKQSRKAQENLTHPENR